MSQEALYTPDWSIVQALKRIDKDLSVRFVDPPARWGIFHNLEGGDELTSAQACEQLARVLQASYRQQGYLVEYDECERQAWHKIQDRNLVCYVVNDDGSFRPLDNRIVQKLERMDALRRNCTIRDWATMMDVRADAAKKARERDMQSVWDAVLTDRVAKNKMHDLLWGSRPFRQVSVPRNFKGVDHGLPRGGVTTAGG